MRTTTSLDEDLATELRQIASERGDSFEATVNSVLRAGLDKIGAGHHYAERTRPLGIRGGIDLTKALAIAAAMEDEGVVVNTLARQIEQMRVDAGLSLEELAADQRRERGERHGG
jgi:plasmid stability protein